MWESYREYSLKHNRDYDDDLVMRSITNTHHIAFERIETFCQITLSDYRPSLFLMV